MSSRPRALLYYGPRHLFWTTGAYALWELSEHYDVTLLLGFDSKGSPKLHDLLSHLGIKRVVTMPSLRSLWVRHAWLSRDLRDLVQTVRPDLVLQYNHVYLDNLYLEHWTRVLAPDALLAKLQMGQHLIDIQADYAARHQFALAATSSRVPLPSFLLASFERLRARLRGVLDLSVLPMLLAGTAFRPPIDLWSGKPRRGNVKGHYDVSYCYLPIECEALRVQEDSSRLQMIRHPVETVGRDFNSFLYGWSDADLQDRVVSLLPSYGEESALRTRNGWSEAELIEHLDGCWMKVIEIFDRMQPEAELAWKLHPRGAKHPVWAEVTRRFSRRLSRLTVVPAEVTAESLMVRSQVVVSDVSTCLWWASFLPGVTAVSLDLFGYALGGAFEGYPGVIVVRSGSELEQLALESSEPALSADTNIDTRPTLAESLAAHRAGRERR